MRSSSARSPCQRATSAATSGAANGSGAAACCFLTFDAALDTGCIITPASLPFVKRESRRISMSRRVVDVLVPVALDHTYSYRVPADMDVSPGDVVCVPIGPRSATAVVWAENPNSDPRLDNRLKEIEQKLDVPPLKT